MNSAKKTANGLRPGVVKVWESILISVASSAPGQATAVTLGILIPATAYAGGVAVLITTLAMLAIAWSYHRLNMWHQNAGASYVWVGRAINPSLGFLVGWIMLAGYALGTVSDILPIGPAVLTLLGYPDVSNAWGEVLTVTVLGLIIIFYSLIGIHATARFQTVISAIEHVILISFCALGIYVVFIEQRAGTIMPSWEWLSPTGVGGQGSLLAGMLIAVYLFTGWDTSIYLNEETENPAQNPGKAALISVAILGFYYTLLVVSLQGAASLEAIYQHSDSALIFIAHELAGAPWDKVMAFAIALSIIGTTQAFLVSAARISFAMGRDRLLPSGFGTVSQKYRTPVLATLFFGVLMILATWFYVFSSSVAGAFDTVVSSVGVLFALFYSATAIATTWAFRGEVASSGRNFVSLGLIPMAGAATLLYVAISSMIDFEAAVQWSLAAIFVSGLFMMFLAKYGLKSRFFSPAKLAAEEDANGRVRIIE